MESIHTLNERLLRDYGKADNGLANYRIVHSDNEIEKRWVTHTKEGLELIRPVVEERPKYKQYIQNRYILERMIFVPEFVESDLVVNHSYEPIWVFRDKDGNWLPPKWEPIKLIIETILRNVANKMGVKYKDPESNPEEALELKKQRIKKIREELFGDDTETSDALHYKEGIVVPSNYGDNNVG